jgi:hypothetical protein
MALKKIGRPKIARKEYKGPGFSVRVTTSERRLVEQAISTSGKKKAEWLRDALLTTAKRGTRAAH